MPARHPLTDAVAAVLPNATDTLLLRGCVDRGREGARALATWLARVPDAVAELTQPQCRWLLPLVQRACEHHGVRPPAALATVAKSAMLRETLRLGPFQAIRGRVLHALADAGVRSVVVKGAALADLVYPDPVLRHAHDVELMIAESDWQCLQQALAPLALASLSTVRGAARAELRHASGLPFVLHRRLFRIPFHNLAGDDVWTRTQATTLAGAPAYVLSPADMLIHACGEAMHAPGYASHRWLVDAWHVLARRRDLDWQVVQHAAARRHMALPLAVVLDYLAGVLGAEVPAAARGQLATLAADDAGLGARLALQGARVAAGGLPALMRRTTSVRGRITIARHVLLPSLDVLWWTTQPHSPTLRKAHGQAFRVARYVVRSVSR